LGAKVIATVGSEDKREFLKKRYGLELMTDSRNTLTWERDVKKFTNGNGVDLVVNSLKGDAIECV